MSRKLTKPKVAVSHDGIEVRLVFSEHGRLVWEARESGKLLGEADKLSDLLMSIERLLVARQVANAPEELANVWASCRARLRPFWELAHQYEVLL